MEIDEDNIIYKKIRLIDIVNTKTYLLLEALPNNCLIVTKVEKVSQCPVADRDPL